MTSRRTSSQILVVIKKTSKYQSKKLLAVSGILAKIEKDTKQEPLYPNLLELVKQYIKRLFRENEIKVVTMTDTLPEELEISEVLCDKPIGKKITGIQSQRVIRAVKTMVGTIYVSIVPKKD